MINRHSASRSSKHLILALLLTSLIACASHPDKIEAAYVSTLKYETYGCAQIALELETVELRTEALYQQLRDTRRADNWQAGVGILLLPTLFALEGGDGVTASEYAFLKGDYEALRHASIQKLCGMQSRSPDEQIEDSLNEDTLIELPNNMLVSLSQVIGLLERAHNQGIISDEELREAQDIAFALLGSDADALTPGALDHLYTIINKTDLGLIAQTPAPVSSPAPLSSPAETAPQALVSPLATTLAQNTEMLTGEAMPIPRDDMHEAPAEHLRTERDSPIPMPEARSMSIESILTDYRHLENFYVDDLPRWKLIRFFEKAGLPTNTPVLGYVDTSIWGSGKNGVMFTLDGIYYTNDFVAGAGGSFYISYEQIVMHAAPIYKRRYFYLGVDQLPKRGLIDFVGTSTDLEEFSRLILDIQSNYELQQDYVANSL